MFLIRLTLVIAAVTISYAQDLKPPSAEVKRALVNYFNNIPDVESRFIVDNHLARTIARLYNNSISAFPVFDVSVKIDRKPVEIPWDIGRGETNDLSAVPLPYVVKEKPSSQVRQGNVDPLLAAKYKMRVQDRNKVLSPVPDIDPFFIVRNNGKIKRGLGDVIPYRYQSLDVLGTLSRKGPFSGLEAQVPSDPLNYDSDTPPPYYSVRDAAKYQDLEKEAMQYVAVARKNRRNRLLRRQ